MDEYESPRKRSANDNNKSPGPIHDYEQYMYGGSVGRDRIEENSPNATIEELDEDDEQILDLVGIDEKSERLFTTSSESVEEQSDVVALYHRNAGWGEIAETENISEEKVEAEREIANEVLAGALMGDFNSDPTFWSDVGQVVTGLIPVAGQLGDIRDLVHILDEICNQKGYKKISSWATLVLIAIAFIPGIGDAVAKLGKKGLRYLDNNRILKKMGEFLGENIIAPILERVGDITAPVVGQIKDAIRRKLAEAQDIARQLGEGVDNVIDNVTGRPQVATEGVGNVASSVDNINQPMQMRGQGSGTYKTPDVVAELSKIPNANLFAPGQLEHVLFGNQNRRGKFTGWHHFPSRLPNERVRIKDFGTGGLVKDSNGVYEATAEASFDGGKTWVEKTAKDHTFFPNEWSKERVVDEIASAFKEGRIKNQPNDPARYFQGRSKSGVFIEGYVDSNGQINTAYPVFGR